MKKFFIVLISIMIICLTSLGVIGYFVEINGSNDKNEITTQESEEITEWKILDSDTLDINKIEGYTPGGTVVEKTVEEIQNSPTNNTNTNSNTTNNTNNSTEESSSGSSSSNDTGSSSEEVPSDNNTSNEGASNDNSTDNQVPPTTETPSGDESSDGASNISLDSNTIATVASLEIVTDSIVASKSTDVKDDTNEEEKVTVTEVGGLELPFTPPYRDMDILSIGGYTGKFVEDGSDYKKENVLAMVIKNTSDKVIDYGEIIIKIQGQNIGLSFKVTDLKPGASALVLESSGEVQFSEDDKYTYLDSSNEFVDEVDMMTDDVKITTKDNKITVENISDENLNTVYVYYKTVSPGGCYLGGITYRAKFVKLTSGKIESAQTHHFDKENSEILRVESVKE